MTKIIQAAPTRWAIPVAPANQPFAVMRSNISIRRLLLGTAALGLVTAVQPYSAGAQIVVPPSTPECVVVGDTANCSGDLSPGIRITSDINTLNVDGLTADIRPAPDQNAIDILVVDQNLTINLDTGLFGIETSGNTAHGVYARNFGTGDIAISSTGDISTDANMSVGIRVRNNDMGDTFVRSEGNISTAGSLSDAIEVQGTAIGDFTVESIGDLTTLGVAASGIWTIASNGQINISSIGNISTSGSFSTGLEAGHLGDGDTNISSIGNISTAERRSAAIRADDRGAGTITIDSRGDLTTQGEESFGIIALNAVEGSINVTSDGAISTMGEAADGIYARHGGNGQIGITADGSIETIGQDAQGIYAQTVGTGDIRIFSMSDVTTSGYGAVAIDARHDGDGDVIIASSGDLLTTGLAAEGISARHIGDGQISITTDGSIETLEDGAQGIYAQTVGTGDIRVDSESDVTTSGYGAGAIEARHDGVGDLVITSSGDLLTTGDGEQGIFARNTGAIEARHYGDGDLIIMPSGDVSTTGDGVNGIYAHHFGNGLIDITSDGAVSTTGRDADGIYARQSNNGPLTIINNGSVTTSGFSSQGITANSIRMIDIRIESVGDITTFNSSSAGIQLIKRALGEIVIISSGDISTHGRVSQGISVRETDGGSVNITSTGNISTIESTSRGIYVREAGLGDVNIDITGDVATMGDNSDGIQARNYQEGDIAISLIGNVATAGNTSVGIRAQNDDAGDTLVRSEGSISTVGYLSHAIEVQGTAIGDFTVESIGDLTTQGDESSGIIARSVVEGDINVTSDGSISTMGDAADGIYARHGGNGLISIVTDGSIETLGQDARGIYAQTAGMGDIRILSMSNVAAYGYGTISGAIDARHDGNGDVIIRSSGDLATAGSSAEAIYARHTGNGQLDVESDGSISTFGNAGHGISAYRAGIGSTGSINIISTGDVQTRGNFASAIEGRHTGYGEVAITTSGTIRTGRQFSHGIYGFNLRGGGGVTINSDSTINVTSYASRGISAINRVNGDIIINSTGDIATSSTRAAAIFADDRGLGSITIRNDGDLTTTFSDGVYARDRGDGNISIASTGDITISGSDADGVYTRTYNGDISVTLAGNLIQGGLGDSSGVFLDGSAGSTIRLNNDATNLTALSGQAITSLDADTIITNSGGITGDIDTETGADILRNTGSIIGNIRLGDGADLVELDAGSTFAGATFDGQTGNDSLRLLGDGDATLDGAQHSNFEVLIKAGAGTFTLTGMHVVGSETAVNGGTLAVDGVLTTGLVNVNTDARLGGTGTINGTVNINAGGILAAGNSPGTLTIGGDLTLDPASILEFELGSPGVVGGPDNDLIIVGGNANIAGTLNLSNGAGGAAVSGVYTLFDVAGTTVGNFSAVNNSGAVSTVDQIITNSGNAPSQFNIIVNNGGQRVQFWDGVNLTANGIVEGGSGTWDAANANWTTSTGAINTAWQSSVGVFGGTAGTVTIAGTQNFEGLQFTVDGYVLTGDAINAIGDQTGNINASFLNADAGTTTTIASVISGVSGVGIDKLGSGTVILTGANNFTGTTTINDGILALTGSGSLASAEITIAGGTLQTDGGALLATAAVGLTGGAFDLDGSETIGALSNNGGMVDIAAGQTLTANNILNSSGTITNAGILRSANPITNGIGASLTTTGLVDGDIVNDGAINAAGSIDGTISNQGAAIFTVTDSVTGNDAFDNIGAATLNVLGGDFTGITVLTNASSAPIGITVATGQTLSTGSLINANGSAISNDGVLLADSVENAGAITGTGNAIGSTSPSFTLQNEMTGTIEGGISGVAAGDIATLNNAGIITGGESGIIAMDIVTLSNSGLIEGSTNGVLANGNIESLTNIAGGTIDGGTGAAISEIGASATSISNAGVINGDIILGAGNDVLDNIGALNGDVDLGGGDDRLILGDGSSFAGVLDGGAGLDQFEISTAAAFTLDGAQHVNFENLVTNGPGTLTLTGTNTFADSTTVSGGSLLVTGTLASAQVAVNSGAALGGSGSITGDVTIGAGATLSPGTSPGALSIGGDLLLDGASTTLFELGGPNMPGGALNDFVMVGGNASIGGTLSLSNGAGGAALSGFYTLFDVSGTITGSFGAIDNGGIGGTVDQIVTNSGNAPSEFNILVNNGGQLVQFWDGANLTANGLVDGGSGTWDAAATNWTIVNGAINAPWQSGVGIFGGTAGDVTVAGVQNIEGLQFTVDGYALSGGVLNLTGDSGGNASASFLNADAGTSTTIASAISGDPDIGLDKFGAGTIILTGTNNFTGATTVNGGRLAVTGTGSLASTDITIFNGSFETDGGALTAATSVTLADGLFDVNGDEVIAELNNVAGTTDIASGATLFATSVINGAGATIQNAGTLSSDNVTMNNAGATLNTTGIINGGVVNEGIVNAQGIFNGAIVNQGTGNFTVTGVLVGDGHFNNAAGAILSVTGGSFSGLATLENAGVVEIAAGRTLVADSITNSGTLRSVDPISIDAVQSLTTTGIVSGGLVNSGTINASGHFSGPVSNQGNGSFTVTGALVGDDIFDNGDSATLQVAGGDYTGITAFTNRSTASNGLTIAAGRTLSAESVVNTDGASIFNGGTLSSDSTVANQAGATLITTGTVNGALSNDGIVDASGSFGGTITNSGAFRPGGLDTVAETAVNGDFIQTASGILPIDVDGAGATNDLVRITGAADLAGSIDVNLTNIDPLGTFTFLTAAGGVTDAGLSLLADPVFANPLAEVVLVFPNANDVALRFSLNTVLAQFNANRTNILDNINAANAQGGGDLGPVITSLFTLGSAQETGAALDQLLPEIYLNAETAALFGAEEFIDNLFSCKTANRQHAFIAEGQCVWARAEGRFLDRAVTFDNIGFDQDSYALSGGAQLALSPEWSVGFAAGYERGRLRTGSAARSTSGSFHAGASLKYQLGPFLLAGAVSGGLTEHAVERTTAFADFDDIASAEQDIGYAAGQLRAAYVFEQKDWYIKPQVDLNLTYLNRDGTTEFGGGASNLATSGDRNLFFSLSPAVELGGEFSLGEHTKLRPFVKAGVSFYDRSHHTLSARFTGAPSNVASFTINSEFNDVSGDIEAGATLLDAKGTDISLSYQAKLSRDTRQHGVFLKGAIRF